MMAGTVTEWEWGWGSGGGWLSGPESLYYCDSCSLTATNTLHLDQAADLDDEADCELGDTDVGADFGDFGF